MVSYPPKRVKKKKENRLIYLICIIAVFLFCFIPTSSNAQIYGVGRTIFIWACAAIMVVAVGLMTHISWNTLLITGGALFAYMLLVTLLAEFQFEKHHISLARIAPLVVLIFLTSITITKVPTFKAMRWLLDIICVIAIVWNVGIIIENSLICNFTLDNYSQYFDNAVFYQVMKNHKPVMSFGVHTYASYFYFIFFVLSYATYHATKKLRYIVYAVAFCLFTLLLTSTTAIIYFVAMVVVLVRELMRKKGAAKFLLAGAALGAVAFVFLQNQDLIRTRLIYNFTNGNNSFVSRYTADAVFKTNLKIITSSLGIGFNVIEDLEVGYSDSGYIVFMTMGHLPLTITIYYLLYKFLYRNLPKEYRTNVILIIFSFEVALPAAFNHRFAFMMIFVICYLNSIANENKKQANMLKME